MTTKTLVAAVAILYITSLAATSCSRTERKPVQLLAGLISYSTPQTVKASLKGYTWHVSDDSGTKRGDQRPSFRVLRWSVEGYSSDGFRGELQITFFNDKLARTTFFPENPGPYFKHVEATFPVTRNQSTVRDKNGARQIVRGIDYRGREYLALEDTGLTREMDKWISRYSWARPVPALRLGSLVCYTDSRV